MEKQRVFITGGAGFLGINLVRYLLAKGYDVTVLDIAPFIYKEDKAKITFVQEDIRHRVEMEKAMKGSDIVIHCAAALPLYPKEEIYSTDVEGTRNVMETSRYLGVKRVIHISTTAVYGIPDHHPLKENDKMMGVGHYGIAKIKAEQVCEEYRKSGMCIPVLRPKSFVGPERLGAFAIYYDWIRRGKSIPIVGNGKNRYQLLDVEDLCDAIYLCMTLPEAKVNTTFNIGAKKFTTMKEDFGSVIKYANTGKRVVGIPAAPLIFTLRILEALKLSPLYKWIYETAHKDSFVSIAKAEKLLGYKPKYSNQDALIRNYQWYMKNLKRFEHQEGISHTVPWKQGILKFVSYFF